MRLTILHTNDIHGRQERIAQIATLVREEKARAEHQVLYLDAGDVEDPSNHLSNVTRGTAMHRLLGQALCDAATVGNASWLRYGADVLGEHARVSPFPQLLANFTPVSGPVPYVLFGEVGVFGLTAPLRGMFEGIDWGFDALDELEVARRCCHALRGKGAHFVVLLSHLGLDVPGEPWDDRRLAAELQDDLDLIVGGHTHQLLPEGERVGRVLIVHAGEFGDHVGRVAVDGKTISASMIAVSAELEPHPSVETEARRIEREVVELLSEPIGVLDERLDAAWVAQMLRVRMHADVGLFAEGLVVGTLPAGLLTRGALWEFSPTGNNPGIAEMTGRQLRDLLRRAANPAVVADTPKPLRGRRRGRLFVAGLNPEQIDDERLYTVAATDWVLDSYGGYTKKEWALQVRYDFPITIREAIEAALHDQSKGISHS